MNALKNWSWLAVSILGIGIAPLRAEVFTVDPEQSTITLSGSALGATLAEQGAGSLKTSFSGTMNVAVGDSTIQFLSGSQIIALDSGNWQPQAGGASGSAPANYGAQATVSLGFFTITAKAAVRRVQLDVSTPPIPLANGQFDSSGMTFLILTNSSPALDYDAGIAGKGGETLAGYATNRITGHATLSVSGNQKTITLPIDTDFYFELLAPNDTHFRLTGQLVASSSSVAMPRIGSIAVSNNIVTLQWQSTAGQTYRVEGSENLGGWTARAAGITSATTDYFWSTNVVRPTDFYRLAQ